MAKVKFLCGEIVTLRCPLCKCKRDVIWLRRLGRDGIALVIKADNLKRVADKPLSVIDLRRFGLGENSWHFCTGGRKAKRWSHAG